MSPLNIDHLLRKYQRPGHRYAYYPNSSSWGGAPSSAEWPSHLESSPHWDQGIQLYLHIPYCESLCTFCGCNINITRDHSVEGPFIEALQKEWDFYYKNFSSLKLTHLYLGGGTPTFLSPQSLEKLLAGVSKRVSFSHDFSGTVEIDPRVTTKDHLKILKDYGFNFISMGIQDTNEKVLINVNRRQSFFQIQKLIEEIQELAFPFLSLDLIYGLPFQSLETIKKTIQDILPLSPHLISFYSYAEVPWLQKLQNSLGKFELPSADEKNLIFQLGRKLLIESDYHELGFQHFVQETSSLWQAQQKKSLHRNLLGHHSKQSKILIGLGPSAISYSGESFVQNYPMVGTYLNILQHQELAFFRGHILSMEDKILQKIYEDLICLGKVNLSLFKEKLGGLYPDWALRERQLQSFAEDHLISSHEGFGFEVTETGRSFLKEICMALDYRVPCPKEWP